MEMHALKQGPVRPATNVLHLAPMPETPLPVVKVPEGQAPAPAQEHKHGAGTHSKSEEKTVWGVAFPYIGHTIKRAFVTGASGFVGRTLIAHLRSKGVENVVVLVPNERAELICRKAGATEFVLGDSNMQTSMLTYGMAHRSPRKLESCVDVMLMQLAMCCAYCSNARLRYGVSLGFT